MFEGGAGAVNDADDRQYCIKQQIALTALLEASRDCREDQVETMAKEIEAKITLLEQALEEEGEGSVEYDGIDELIGRLTQEGINWLLRQKESFEAANKRSPLIIQIMQLLTLLEHSAGFLTVKYLICRTEGLLQWIVDQIDNPSLSHQEAALDLLHQLMYSPGASDVYEDKEVKKKILESGFFENLSQKLAVGHGLKIDLLIANTLYQALMVLWLIPGTEGHHKTNIARALMHAIARHGADEDFIRAFENVAYLVISSEHYHAASEPEIDFAAFEGKFDPVVAAALRSDAGLARIVILKIREAIRDHRESSSVWEKLVNWMERCLREPVAGAGGASSLPFSSVEASTSGSVTAYYGL